MKEINASEKLQRAGSAARAAGIGAPTNPFCQPVLMPAGTGESVHEWQCKVEAWDRSRLMEDVVGLGSACAVPGVRPFAHDDRSKPAGFMEGYARSLEWRNSQTSQACRCSGRITGEPGLVRRDRGRRRPPAGVREA